MQLHYAKGTIAIAVAITLFDAGIDFEPVEVDFPNAAQTKPAFHAINPKGRVPALVTSRGVLTETGAILDYIAALHPRAELIPGDPFQAARMRELMYYIASTLHVAHAHKMRGPRWATKPTSFKDMAEKVQENMSACADLIETHYLTGPFVLGDRFSLADPYLFTAASWFPKDGVDLDQFPALTRFMSMMETRDSVQQARQLGMI